MIQPLSTDASLATFDAVVSRLPVRLQRVVERTLSRWPGRVMIRSAASFVRIELFDRSMTIAAQFFTSIFPTVIVLASWVQDDGKIAEALGLPQETRSILEKTFQPSSGSATFGIVGTVIVLGSATSLSRALTRAFAAMWGLPRPTIKLTSAWRWVAVVIALALGLVTARALTRYLQDAPPPTFWGIVTPLAFDLAIGVFVPWILLSGRIAPRRLMPGAALFGTVMLLLRPASAAWLPRALEVSADRYGSIGVAFTYLAWLYVVSFCFLTAAVVGQVVASDAGRLGRLIRGGRRSSPRGDAPRPAVP